MAAYVVDFRPAKRSRDVVPISRLSRHVVRSSRVETGIEVSRDSSDDMDLIGEDPGKRLGSWHLAGTPGRSSQALAMTGLGHLEASFNNAPILLSSFIIKSPLDIARGCPGSEARYY